MSGEPEIEEWVEDNFDSDFFFYMGYTDTEQIYAYLNKMFEDDNRSDLDHILRDERKEFMTFLGSYFKLKEKQDRRTQYQKVYDYLREVKIAQKPKQMALALGLPQPSVRRILQELVREEAIGRIAKGLYRY